MGFATWSEAVTAVRDRAGWGRQVNGPILPEETENKSSKSLWVETYKKYPLSHF